MFNKERIKILTEEAFPADEMFIVDITISADNKIFVYIDSDTSVNIDDCVQISRHIEDELNKDELDFELNVSSAGLSNPLKLKRQYKKHLGQALEVLTTDGKKTKGKLTAVNQEGIELEITEKVKLEGKKRKQEIARTEAHLYSNIKIAKLLISFK